MTEFCSLQENTLPRKKGAIICKYDKHIAYSRKLKQKACGGGQGGIYIGDQLCENTKKKKHCERLGQKKTSFYERDAMHHKSNYHTPNNVGGKRREKKINHYKYDNPKLTRISLKSQDR